ncbi:hypothetical protein MKS88_000488 [Plasmodium brasilianum]|uniref:Uncharacterized protein n=2 Tax=Plasmodium (Plasmodium) TaxID=418103 RepID=A0A1A8WJ63_PLAMA|nr:conserved Plasmodium protein, unknown function [Plasmodium malariae]KAI4841250.1 hypothetical protein MKS88_000488 [Plasmodium brasilianum]SBS92997.1 hypothetical protein PMALA_038070 [Plasmodium malariae]SBT86937.1 conserved Plasmodium protein, unknown function [Plasmodium malariae]
MNFHKYNDKKRHLTTYGDEHNFQPPQGTSSSPPSVIHGQQVFYLNTIPQFPYTQPIYNHHMNYVNMIHNSETNYISKRSMKKKKNYHQYNKHHNNENSHLREAVEDPWGQLYGRYPGIHFT